MRKRHITPTRPPARSDRDDRLDLSTAALVEVTSEEKEYPIESALIPGELKGWRAAEPGTHTIRLVFGMFHQLPKCLFLGKHSVGSMIDFCPTM